MSHLSEAANLFDRHVEAEEVEGLASHRGEIVHAHGFLLSKRKVTIHPHFALRFWTQLVQPGYLLISGGRGTGLLQGQK